MAEEPQTTEEPEAVQDAGPEAAAEAAPEVPAAASAPVEVVAPKERRARARAAKAAKRPAGTPLTPEERHAERAETRSRKAATRRVERQRARTKAKAAPSATPIAAREHAPRVQKTRQGVVVSDKADKTITVRIDVARRHRRYEKIVRTSNTLHAHDERNDAHVGDTVIVRESRPLSRTKRWRLVEVVERAR